MSEGPGFVRGIYAHPASFWATGARLDEYGINAIFVHSDRIDTEVVQRAKSEGARVFSAFATLNGRGYIEEHPEAWPVNELGEPASPATWFIGACPTEPGFRSHRLEHLATHVRQYDLDGVFIGYLHWHAQFEDPDPILPETCFSPSCVAAFSEATKVDVPKGPIAEQATWILSRHEAAWRDWRCSILAQWVVDIRGVIEHHRPGIILGNYQCPWNEVEFGGAHRSTLGFDIDLIAPLVDVMSPMVYDGRMGRSPEWVGEAVEWLRGRIGEGGPEVWPIVQAGEVRPELPRQDFSAEHLTHVLELSRAAGGTGTSMFAIDAVTADPAKLAALRTLYTRWASEREDHLNG